MSEAWTPLRIKRLELEHFKAYSTMGVGPVVFEFGDADIVLVVGANGRGKTTLIEALELALTGEYAPRVGDKTLDREAKELYRDFIHNYSAADGLQDRVRASVRVEWAAAPGQAPRVEEVHVSSSKVAPSGTWTERRVSLDLDAAQTRARTLFYAESLGGILGNDPAARTIITDAFIGPRPEVQQVVSQLDPHLGPLLKEKKRKLEADRAALIQANAAMAAPASALESAWSGAVREKLSLRTASGDWSKAKMSAALKQMQQGLGVQGQRSTGSVAIRELKDAADQRAAAQREAHIQAAAARGQRGSAWAAVQVAVDDLQRLNPQRSPGGAPLDSLDALQGALTQVAQESAELEGPAQGLRVQIAQIWSSLEVDPPEAGRPQTLTVGRLPLLYGLARPEASSLLSELGFTVREGQLEGLGDRIASERARLSELREALRANQGRLDALKVRREDIERQLKLQDAWTRLGVAWQSAMDGRAPPLDDSGSVDLLAVRRLAETTVGALGAAADWARLTEALGTFEDALQRLEQAEADQPDGKEGERALKELARIEGIVEALRGAPKRTSLQDLVRSHLIREHYQASFHDATMAVLGAYDHQERIGKRLHVGFRDNGALQVRVGSQRRDGELDGGEQGATGALSLSRSQFISVSFALAVAANLGQEDPQLGFICLDDVADALDVDNLAAEATVLRRLAYADEPRMRRQLIITSHNSELTDRLVPLLLPPPERTMRILRIVEKRGDDGVISVVPEVYKVVSDRQLRGDRSPLRAILPER